jgi:hypothetical protein
VETALEKAKIVSLDNKIRAYLKDSAKLDNEWLDKVAKVSLSREKTCQLADLVTESEEVKLWKKVFSKLPVCGVLMYRKNPSKAKSRKAQMNSFSYLVANIPANGQGFFYVMRKWQHKGFMFIGFVKQSSFADRNGIAKIKSIEELCNDCKCRYLKKLLTEHFPPHPERGQLDMFK